ncbi:phosphocarrier protein [Acetoanaerobium pronyense]|uniref:Phosphocarrier protein HPr n=1 Tax=Acetoanaerobium pronyense TaxID=1482736 RepID=A0ABS4KGC4_9FIRM|nr:HPr family phosphocarrier protein [Acetoanaerobium pronyense]MBP2026833.1 phosphocarrier protein [Acetoanaerobium pronyense]
MIKKEVVIKNKIGLHARPAALFVQTANKFISEIMVKKGNSTINAKSIMGIMALGVSHGETIEIIVDGPDEENAIQELEYLVDNKLLDK